MSKQTLKQLFIKMLIGFIIILLINSIFGLDFKAPTFIAYMIIGPIFIFLFERKKFFESI